MESSLRSFSPFCGSKNDSMAKVWHLLCLRATSAAGLCEKNLKNLTLILIVRRNICNSTSRNRKKNISNTFNRQPTQTIVCYNPEQTFPNNNDSAIIGLILSLWFGIMWIYNKPGLRKWRHFPRTHVTFGLLSSRWRFVRPVNIVFTWATAFVTCSYATTRNFLLSPSVNRYFIALINVFTAFVILTPALPEYYHVRSECAHRHTSSTAKWRKNINMANWNAFVYITPYYFGKSWSWKHFPQLLCIKVVTRSGQ